MPNFTAATRLSYRDIDGLIVSCTRADIEEDPTNPGFVKRWRNRAPGLPSLPSPRVPADIVTYAGGRFGDFVQLNQALQPELAIVLGQRKVRFNRTDSTFLSSVIPVDFPDATNVSGAAVAFQFAQGANVADIQTVYDDQQSMKVTRRQAGVRRFKIGATSSVGASDLASGRWLATSDGVAVSAARDRTLDPTTQVGASTFSIAPGVAYLGRSTTGDYLDGDLDSFHVWARTLSPLEQDFVWATVDEDNASFSVNPYAAAAANRWTDVTGDPSLSQINRLRSDVNQLYKLVTVDGVASMRVQIAAAEEGHVKPDANLIGNTFSLRWLEKPGVVPLVLQSVGWSSVFDCVIKIPGHYTAQVFREDGGSVLLHFDAEVSP